MMSLLLSWKYQQNEAFVPSGVDHLVHPERNEERKTRRR